MSEFVPDRDLLIDLRFHQHMTREQIAEHFDTTVTKVRRWIKDLDIPRPVRKQKPKNVARRSGRIKDPMDGYNVIQRAQIFLEGRLVDRQGYGYYLDGRPASVEDIAAALDVACHPK